MPGSTMKILYHLTVLPPPLPECEALSQEIVSLRQQFTSDLVYINPNQKLPVPIIPRVLFGFHQIQSLRKQEAAVTLHHFYNPDPFPFPVLRWLHRPVIYTISSGLGDRSPNTAFFNALAAVTVYDRRSLKQLEAWVPRKGTKEGKALHAHFYTKETEEPTGLDLAHRLQLDLFPEGMGMCTPGFHKLDDGRWLLNTADTRWTPPEGCKRISDIEYEALIEADERRSNMTPS